MDDIGLVTFEAEVLKVDVKRKNNRVFTKEALEKMVNDFNSSLNEVKNEEPKELKELYLDGDIMKGRFSISGDKLSKLAGECRPAFSIRTINNR